MTTTEDLLPALRRAAVRATTAASFYNTQPWRIELSRNRLRLLADRSRQLAAHDPTGRQLTISCGCALLNARVSLAGEGFGSTVVRFPAGTAPGAPLADLEPDRGPGTDPGGTDALARLAKVVETRSTNRAPFRSSVVPGGVIRRLQAVAAAEGAELLLFTDPAHHQLVSALQSEAGRINAADPACQAEHRAWALTAGLPIDGSEQSSATEPNVLVLSTAGDDEQDWLRAGEALQRILLEIAEEGCAVGLDSRATQVATTREELRTRLRLDGRPQLLLQLGTATAGPPTRRRRLMEVISEPVSETP